MPQLIHRGCYREYYCNVCEKRFESTGGRYDPKDPRHVRDLLNLKEEAYEHIKDEHPERCIKDGKGNLFVTEKERREFNKKK